MKGAGVARIALPEASWGANGAAPLNTAGADWRLALAEELGGDEVTTERTLELLVGANSCANGFRLNSLAKGLSLERAVCSLPAELLVEDEASGGAGADSACTQAGALLSSSFFPLSLARGWGADGGA